MQVSGHLSSDRRDNKGTILHQKRKPLFSKARLAIPKGWYRYVPSIRGLYRGKEQITSEKEHAREQHVEGNARFHEGKPVGHLLQHLVNRTYFITWVLF